MSKEHFIDNEFSLNKVLHHVKIARDYVIDLKDNCPGPNAKQLFQNYLNKLDFIFNDVYVRCSREIQQSIKQDTNDSLALDSIMDLLNLLNPEQRLIIEGLAKALSKGEKIEFIEENKY